jgi:CheY-like chemotaxis protein
MARILLIDDDETLRDTMTQLLMIDRHQVVQAADGAEGLQRYEEGGYDVVITDVLMPKLDGAEVIVRIRQNSPAQPVIAISGGRRNLSPSFNLQTATLAGATFQLTKPFTRQQLQAAVAQALQAA